MYFWESDILEDVCCEFCGADVMLDGLCEDCDFCNCGERLDSYGLCVECNVLIAYNPARMDFSELEAEDAHLDTLLETEFEYEGDF